MDSDKYVFGDLTGKFCMIGFVEICIGKMNSETGAYLVQRVDDGRDEGEWPDFVLKLATLVPEYESNEAEDNTYAGWEEEYSPPPTPVSAEVRAVQEKDRARMLLGLLEEAMREDKVHEMDAMQLQKRLEQLKVDASEAECVLMELELFCDERLEQAYAFCYRGKCERAQGTAGLTLVLASRARKSNWEKMDPSAISRLYHRIDDGVTGILRHLALCGVSKQAFEQVCDALHPPEVVGKWPPLKLVRALRAAVMLWYALDDSYDDPYDHEQAIYSSRVREKEVSYFVLSAREARELVERVHHEALSPAYLTFPRFDGKDFAYIGM